MKVYFLNFFNDFEILQNFDNFEHSRKFFCAMTLVGAAPFNRTPLGRSGFKQNGICKNAYPYND
jgi:hypothetical protein